jgi:hypothetical protein
MPELTATAVQEIVIEIGRYPVLVRSDSAEFLQMLEWRYAGFLSTEAQCGCEFDVELVPPGRITDENDVAVRFEAGRWRIERGDLWTEWDPRTRRGRIVQSANPYSIDAALRILHSLILAREGGLLMHAASAIRNGKAFLFAGVSGAGKTTISRLAPADVKLLTDEISYLKHNGHGYAAYGTPFAGELAKVGENAEARLAAIYMLHKGLANTMERMRDAEAVRMLLKNVLFFANDPDLTGQVFETACKLASSVPVYRLTFFPDERVWELIA